MKTRDYLRNLVKSIEIEEKTKREEKIFLEGYFKALESIKYKAECLIFEADKEEENQPKCEAIK